MEVYLTFAVLWTLWMAFETYVYARPQSRPHFVGFLITHLLLAPLSFVLSLSHGILRERITAAYRAASQTKRTFQKTGRKKLIG